jgi:putative effector of murein hydrolase LrgA (UPF0299 family)
MSIIRGFTALLLLQTMGELLARGLGLPFPGPVVGMVLLIPALFWAPLRREIGDVAQFLLQHLSLLFVPVGVGVVTHLGLLESAGLRLLLVIVVSTWIGLWACALCLRALWPDDPSPSTPVAASDGEAP